MNVSESIDWRHAKPWELDLHRFIAITNSGQTLDGWLKYFPRAYGYWTIQDSDFFTDIFRPNRQDNQPLHGRIQIHQRPQGDTETMQRKDSGIMTGRTRQEQVQRMHRNGYTALEIAGQLNIPLPEVIAVIGS